jgi:hypothetical protein
MNVGRGLAHKQTSEQELTLMALAHRSEASKGHCSIGDVAVCRNRDESESLFQFSEDRQVAFHEEGRRRRVDLPKIHEYQREGRFAAFLPFADLS